MAKKKEKKEILERDYNIPLRRRFVNVAKHKKTPKAVRAVREFLLKHMKSDKVRLGMHLNDHLWEHGIKNPPHHVKVHVIKEGDEVRAELHGFEFKEAVRAEKKSKEPASMKEKLAKKLGVDDKAVAAEKKKEDEKDVPKVEVKQEEKPAEPEKKSESKPEINNKKPAAKPATATKEPKKA